MDQERVNQGYEWLDRGNVLLNGAWWQASLFSGPWFFLVSLTILPWVIWFFVHDRSKTKPYLISGILMILISTILDIIGISYDLWRYYVKVIPVLSGLFPWNGTFIPVIFLLSYQFKREWNPWVKGIIVSMVFSFVGEPLTEKLGFVSHLHWNHFYSFPFYLFIYIVSYYAGAKLHASYSIAKDGEDLESRMRMELKCNSVFHHSFDSIYCIEKKHHEKKFRFTQVNPKFCEEIGYSLEELKQLDPRCISDQSMMNVDVKYRPLLKNGEMELETVVLTKSGEKKYAKIFCKAYRWEEKMEIICIARFLAQEIVEDQIN